MSLPTCIVTTTVYLASGNPDLLARLRAKLSTLETDGGFVVPSEAEACADPVTGLISLPVWPNARGTAGSTYSFTLEASERTERLTGVVPAQPTATLQSCVALPSAPALPTGTQAIADALAAGVAANVAATTATQQAAIATSKAAEAAGSAGAAAGSAGAASGSAGAAAASAGAAAGSASAADTSAKAAAGSATAAGASAGAAAGSAGAAAGSATAAGTSATQAGTYAGQAQGYRDTAAQYKQAASDSAGNASVSAGAAAGSANASAASAAAAAGSATAIAGSVQQAATSALSANSDAVKASASASLALAVYGTSSGLNAAQQIMLGYANTAQAQAGLATAQAQAASSVAQQDLSGATLAALHRSPNPVVQAIVYDTSKDYLGGAWREQCANLSWMNEPLNGNWLASTSPEGFQSELDARGVGATLGAEVNPDPTFSSAVGWTLTPVEGAAASSIGGGKFTWAGVGSGNTLAQRLDPAGGALTAKPYQVTLSVDSLSVFCGVRVCLGDGTIVFVANAIGTHTFTVVPPAGSTLKLVALGGANSGAISKFSVKPVTAFNTKSGDFYQLAGDGKFYRLFLNLIPGSASPAAAQVFSAGGAAPAVSTIAGTPQSGVAGTVVQVVWPAAGDTRVRMQVPAAGVNLAASIYYSTSPNGPWTRAINKAGAFSGANGFADFGPGDFGTGYSSTTYLCQAQLEYGTVSTAYEDKAAGVTSALEIFRGNTAKFPRMAAIVAEATSLTIYDLLAVGRPMWMRFEAQSSSLDGAYIRQGGNVSCVAALNGLVAFGGLSAGQALVLMDFPKDRARRIRDGSAALVLGPFSERGINVAHNGYQDPLDTRIVNLVINSIAMMARPTAPLDPVTGLPIPTIGVAVGTGNAGQVGSVIMDDGSVVNYSQASNDGKSVAFTARGDVVWGFSASSSITAMPLATAAVANTQTAGRTYNAATGPSVPTGVAKKVVVAGNAVAGVSSSANALSLTRENPSTPTASLAAQITGTYNSGWLPGDIRRAMFIDTVAGVAGSTVTFLAGDDATFTNSLGAWTVPYQGTGAVVGGQAVITSNGTPYFGRNFTGLIPGYAYRFDFDLVGRSNAAANINLFVGDTANALANTKLGNFGAQTNGVGKNIVFTANETGVAFIQFNMTGAAVGDTFTVDNVQVTQAYATDRSAKAKNATINGTLTKTAVAAASQMVAWGGFSNDPLVELVTNGGGTGSQFTSTAGWVPQSTGVQTGGTVSIVAGNLRVQNDNTGTNYGTTQFAFATVPGRKYALNVGRFGGSAGGGVVHIGTGTTSGTPTYGILANYTGASTTFVAQTATTYVSVQPGSSAAGGYFDFSSISIKAADAIGSAANCAQEPWSADHDPALAALGGSAWFNVPATGFGPANFIRNSTFAGDTMTDGSLSAPANGITVTVVGYGTEGGMRYVDIQASGTPTASSSHHVTFSGAASRVPATLGQVFTGSVYATLVGGSLANLGAAVELVDYDASTTPVASSATPLTVTAGSLPVSRFSVTRVAQAASVATCALRAIRFNYTSGLAINATIRLGLPQVERGATVGLPIATTNAAYIGIAPIYDRSAPTGAYYRWGVDGNGMLACELSDGTTVRRVTTTQAVNTGTWVKGEWAYVPNGANTTLTLKVNAVPQTPLTFAALGTLSNAAALMTWGNARTLDAAFPGQLALVKPSMTIPTAEQSTWMYAQELPMFNPGAQVTLADTGNLLDMAYDAQENSLTVASATMKSKFVGLVRTHSEAPTAGSFAAVAHTAGIKLLSRTGTNPGVDISLPSQNLKEELLRREEAAAARARLTERRDFDTIAGQTDIAAPAGWEWKGVTLNGADKREGSTKDWIRLYDGFIESVRFNAAPGAAWVQGELRRAA